MRDTLNELQRAIEHETCRVIALRFTMENQRRADQMARLIEIKGLGADIAAVKKGIGDLRAAATELNTEKSGLTAEIKDLTEQLKQHRADLRFEAETLGNCSGDTDTEETKKPPAASVSSAIGVAATDRVALGPHPDQPEVVTTVIGDAATEYAEAVDKVNRSTDRDIAEVEQHTAETFRAAE